MKPGRILSDWFKNIMVFGEDVGAQLFIRNHQIKREVQKPLNPKKKLVEEERAHAALVFDGDICVGWCQFGPTQELPNIYHKKEVESKMTMPDWRITCIYVDRDYRKQGLSFFALNGALELIKNLGGGVVESYPQDTEGHNPHSAPWNSGI